MVVIILLCSNYYKCTYFFYSFTHPTKGLCTGKARGMNECSGYCSSMYTVGRAGASMSKCTCCKPTAFEPLSVVYNCENSKFHNEVIDNPSSCDCSLCSNN